jgi:hypothetical protein
MSGSPRDKVLDPSQGLPLKGGLREKQRMRRNSSKGRKTRQFQSVLVLCLTSADYRKTAQVAAMRGVPGDEA